MSTTKDRTLTASQVAAILQKAANYRPDVRKATIKVDLSYDRSILIVDIQLYTTGRRYQAERVFTKCLDGRTCGEILAEWIGEMSPQSLIEAFKARSNNSALIRERRRYLENTVPQVLEMQVTRHKNPTPMPTRSKFKWDAPRPTAENPSGMIKNPIPEQPVEAGHKVEVVTGDTKYLDDKTITHEGVTYRAVLHEGPYCTTERDVVIDGKVYTRCLKRDQMIAMGWEKDQRARQYRLQRGKHPNDSV